MNSKKCLDVLEVLDSARRLRIALQRSNIKARMCSKSSFRRMSAHRTSTRRRRNSTWWSRCTSCKGHGGENELGELTKSLRIVGFFCIPRKAMEPLSKSVLYPTILYEDVEPSITPPPVSSSPAPLPSVSTPPPGMHEYLDNWEAYHRVTFFFYII